jgi:hypothetical protein
MSTIFHSLTYHSIHAHGRVIVQASPAINPAPSLVQLARRDRYAANREGNLIPISLVGIKGDLIPIELVGNRQRNKLTELSN